MRLARRSPKISSVRGQALTEFVLALPVLFLIMLAAYSVGAAMYSGANASTALRSALENKFDYADSDQALNQLRDKVNNTTFGTFTAGGSNIDTDGLSVTSVNKETSILVARKSIKFPLFPRFTFFVTQGLPTDLLDNNTPPFTLPSAIPFNAAVPQAGAAVNPAAFVFDPVGDPLPGTLRFSATNSCNIDPGDMAALAAKNKCGAALCSVTNSTNYTTAYTNATFNHTSFNACTDTFKTTTDVSFPTVANPY